MGRRRRPAEETQAEMLQVAEALLREHGPAGVKLDDIARTVGVSRQAVLHHFGNREGLMQALVRSAWLGLFQDLATLTGAAEGTPDTFVDHVDDVVRKRGNARLGAWLLLSDSGLPDEVFEGALSGLPAALGTDPDVAPEDALLLVGAALFGDAIFGGRLRQVLGLPDDEASRERFRRVLARRVWSVE